MRDPQLLQLSQRCRGYITAKDRVGWGQPSPRVLGRDFLLEGSTDTVYSYRYCIGQGDFSRLRGPMAQRSLYPRKSPGTMENVEAAGTGDPVAQKYFKTAAGAPCSLLGETGGRGGE